MQCHWKGHVADETKQGKALHTAVTYQAEYVRFFTDLLRATSQDLHVQTPGRQSETTTPMQPVHGRRPSAVAMPAGTHQVADNCVTMPNGWMNDGFGCSRDALALCQKQCMRMQPHTHAGGTQPAWMRVHAWTCKMTQTYPTEHNRHLPLDWSTPQCQQWPGSHCVLCAQSFARAPQKGPCPQPWRCSLLQAVCSWTSGPAKQRPQVQGTAECMGENDIALSHASTPDSARLRVFDIMMCS